MEDMEQSAGVVRLPSASHKKHGADDLKTTAPRGKSGNHGRPSDRP